MNKIINSQLSEKWRTTNSDYNIKLLLMCKLEKNKALIKKLQKTFFSLKKTNIYMCSYNHCKIPNMQFWYINSVRGIKIGSVRRPWNTYDVLDRNLQTARWWN